MTERTGGSDVVAAPRPSRSKRRRRLAAVRHEVVHLGDHVADGAHARAPRGQRRRAAAGSRCSTSSCATRTGGCANIHGQPAQGQARHAQGADRGAHARRRARDRWSARPSDGIRTITPMLIVTRTWNAVGAVAAMRRGLALARDYARRRIAFGALLVDKPLHADTLAALEAEYEGAFCLAFRAVELLGALEDGRRRATEDDERLSRALDADREADDRQAGGRGDVARRSRRSAAPATSRTPGCRGSSPTRRCCRSGKARRTCSRSTRCARSARAARSRRSPAEIERMLARRRPMRGSRSRSRPRARRCVTRPRGSREAMAATGSARGRRAPVRAHARPRARARAPGRSRAVVPRSRPRRRGPPRRRAGSRRTASI